MFTMAIGPRGQAQRKGWEPTKAVRLAALLGALVLMSIAVNALTIFADRRESAWAFRCGRYVSAVTETTDQVACYRTEACPPGLRPIPSRGANAPALGGLLSNPGVAPSRRCPSCVTPHEGRRSACHHLFRTYAKVRVPSLSILYAVMEILKLMGCRQIDERSWKMSPFVASQAVALSQARREASKASANGRQNATPRTGKGFFSRSCSTGWSNLAGAKRQWRYSVSVACVVRALDRNETERDDASAL